MICPMCGCRHGIGFINYSNNEEILCPLCPGVIKWSATTKYENITSTSTSGDV